MNGDQHIHLMSKIQKKVLINLVLCVVTVIGVNAKNEIKINTPDSSMEINPIITSNSLQYFGVVLNAIGLYIFS